MVYVNQRLNFSMEKEDFSLSNPSPIMKSLVVIYQWPAMSWTSTAHLFLSSRNSPGMLYRKMFQLAHSHRRYSRRFRAGLVFREGRCRWSLFGLTSSNQFQQSNRRNRINCFRSFQSLVILKWWRKTLSERCRMCLTSLAAVQSTSRNFARSFLQFSNSSILSSSPARTFADSMGVPFVFQSTCTPYSWFK